MTEPHWLKIARTYTCIKETPGTGNTPAIMAWAKKLGIKVLGAAYNADSVPWCGLFAAEIATAAGFKPPAIALRASSWDNFGVPVTKPYLGAFVRFQRPGGGHIAIITGQDATAYRVLGGNQSDKVCETWIAKDRAVALRWPTGADKPTILAPMVARSGKVSTDEA